MGCLGTPVRVGDIAAIAAQGRGSGPHLRIVRVVGFEEGDVVVTGIMQRPRGRQTWRKEVHQLVIIGEAANRGRAHWNYPSADL